MEVTSHGGQCSGERCPSSCLNSTSIMSNVVMPSSLERPGKRARTMTGEAESHLSIGDARDIEAAASNAKTQQPPAACRQPLVQKQGQQQQQQQPQVQSQQRMKSSQLSCQQSQLQLQPPSQHRPQPHQTQLPLLLSGAVSMLATAIPQWAEDALRGVDPFWQPKEILAVITTRPTAAAPGTHGQLQSACVFFTVSPAALAAFEEKRAQARMVCVQPGDGLPRRCHWYGGSYVMLNGRSYEVTKEDRVQLVLGPNQADQAVDLSRGLVRGANLLTLLWPLGVAGAVAVLRLCEPRSEEGMRRSLAPPLPLPQAVALVQTYVAGRDDASSGAGATAVSGGKAAAPPATTTTTPQGNGGADDTDADTDGAVSSGPVTVSLRCPLHGGLVTAPAHFGAMAAASPLAFFDVGGFLQLARGHGSWICPASGRLGNVEDLRPHAFLSAVLRTLDHNGVRGRVEAIEVSPCGRWRPKNSRVPLLSVLDTDPTDPTVPGGRPPPSFDLRLLDPGEDAGGLDVVDLTSD
ncbi:hypothetical protein VaNZ11_001175 [Volvox africanus]|uniref:SP-RING-type domain-containing protein n=1 Tax=Volvox africanus TaxID=51714 RepID=A0ABQ5RP52_9CHLO|nr:hypothetical protein VaNZ11_001175 [Volvox africanus]